VGICIFLVAITWLVFGQTLHYGFVNYDDDRYVYENPEVRSGLTIHGIAWAFTHSHGSNWHPLTSISHMLDCQLFGLKAGGHHFTNVCLHTVAVLLLFFVLRTMTGSLWRSAFVATVFAIHPLHVESVAWISERKDVLSAVFFMLTLGAYVRYLNRPSRGRYVTMAIFFALGLMSKPMIVTTPFVLLLLDYWPLRRLESFRGLQRLIVEKIPLFALSAISCVATMLAQRQGVASAEVLPLGSRISNTFVALVTYLWQMIWPARLAVFYSHPENTLPFQQVALAIALLALFTITAIPLRRRCPYLVTGWFWYLGMLVPVIGLIQVGSQAHADRYTYLPQIGLYLMATWSVADALAGWPHRRRILVSFAAIVIVALALCGWRQTSYWRDSESLWTHTLAVTSGNFIAHNDLGGFFLDRNRIDEAIDQFQMSAKIRPSYADAQNNLGVALTKKGLPDEAIAHLQRALQLRPNEAKPYYNLGNAFLQKGELEQAIVDFQKALATRPHYAEAHYNLGIAFTQKGDVNAAIAQYQQAVEDKPDYAEACYALGNGFLEKGQTDEAIARYQRALKIRPDYPEVLNNIGLALLQRGRPSEAIAHWQKALDFRSDFVDVLNNLAWVLATFPDTSIRNGARAIKLAERARQLSSDINPAILRTLAGACAENGRFGEAIDIAQEGLQVAKAQGNPALVDIFESDIALYRTNSPIRTAAQPRNSPSP
jgi:tetratricopeptide (TPR) repeat protein